MAKTNSVKSSLRTAMMTVTPEQMNDMIRKKAYELYMKRGKKSGGSLSDWLEAERIVKASLK